MKNKDLTFKDLITQKSWGSYTDFVNELPGMIEKEVKENIEHERKLITDLKKDARFKKLTVRKVNDLLPRAEKMLAAGDVIGIDGTMSKFEFISGIRCQIGVVATNYMGDQIKHSFFISNANFDEEPEDALERINFITESGEELSNMALRGVMLYKEREAGLDEKFGGKHVMFHGPLLPFELMSGLGRLRALPTTLNLLKKLVSEKRFFGIISSSSFKEYLYFGRAIEPGEYLTFKDFTLGHYLEETSNFMKYKDKWRDEERDDITDFINDYASKIKIGVIRISQRPYVFHAHEDTFDLEAAIIAKDSMFQAQKGFPLLIDYADSLCSEYFSSSQFRHLVEWELAKNNSYLTEASERDLRLK